MARIAYDSHDAAAFEATRHVPGQGLVAWREAVAKHLNPRPGIRLLEPIPQTSTQLGWLDSTAPLKPSVDQFTLPMLTCVQRVRQR